MTIAQPVFLNQSAEIAKFLDFLYKEQAGLVYIATKHPETEVWEQSFFTWPTDKELITSHVIQESPSKEVYIGPALYSTNNATKGAIRGTNVYWTEFDGNLPSSDKLRGYPEPTLRVLSSESGHEHWYWALDSFDTNVEQIERANRGLTYGLDADSSAWDATQVLRPPTTVNHKRQKSVLVLSRTETVYSPELFAQIPAPDYSVKEIILDELPDPLFVLSKYKWTNEMFTLFRQAEKDIPIKYKSTALMKLGYFCTELRMLDEEAYAIIANADQRWGKFTKRSDRTRRLMDIIFKARLKYPFEVTEPEYQDTFPVFAFQDFLDTDIHIEWIVEGLLQKSGSLLLSGPPGLGKTTISLQFAIAMALGREFLGWKLPPTKILFISMEMGHADLKYFIEQMAEALSEDERLLLQSNLLFVPLGFGVFLDKPGEQKRVTELVKKYEPEGVFFDSLGSTTMDELTSEVTVKAIMDYTERLRQDYSLFTWFIHHNRKAQATNKKPNKLSDVYGSQYITARSTTVLGLWGVGTDTIEVTGLKIRLAKAFAPFTIVRGDHLTFSIGKVGAGLLKSVEEDFVITDDGDDNPGQSFMGMS